MDGSSGVSAGTMIKASRFPEIPVLGMSAWRQSITRRISECKGERVEIFRGFPKNTTRTLRGEKPSFVKPDSLIWVLTLKIFENFLSNHF